MKLWAIKWGPWKTNPRSRGYIDTTTISGTRRDAWKAFEKGALGNATDSWRATLKRRRRSGEIRAVRIEVKELP